MTHQKNAFKSKNLLTLIQISEMDEFKRIASDCFRQNRIEFSFDEIDQQSIEINSEELLVDDLETDPLLNFD